MGLILDQIVEGIECVTVREPPNWPFWSAGMPLFRWFYLLFLYDHSFICFFFFFFFFIFYIVFLMILADDREGNSILLDRVDGQIE